MIMAEIYCEVVVVGLGAMGSAILDQLAIRGVDVVGVDRFTPPHDRGSSHGSTRITRQALGEGTIYVPFVLASHKRWRELESETGAKLLEQCGAVMIGSMGNGPNGHLDGDFLKNTFEAAEKFGIEHEKLDRSSVVSRYPQFAGMREDDIAYYEPGAGYVFPERCIDTQIKYAKSNGARVYTDEPIRKVEETESGVKVSSDNLIIHAGKAIVAAGAWISYLLGDKYKNLFEVRRQTLFWLELESGYKFPAGSPIYIWEDGCGESGYFYGFPPVLDENSVKVGSENLHSVTTPDKLDRIVTDEEARDIIETHVKGHLKGVSDKVLDRAACLLTFTPDSNFLIDYHPEMQNVFVVSACSGHGFKNSAGVGEAVAKTIVGEDVGIDMSPFKFDRFT